MKGRKPKLTLIDGGKGRGKCPIAPAWLSEWSKLEWRRVAPQLFTRKMLSPDVLATVEAYCVAVGIVRECEERMGDDGRLIASEKGLVPHPAFKMQSAAMREARLLATELGLTRVGAGGKASDKPANDWNGSDELLA